MTDYGYFYSYDIFCSECLSSFKLQEDEIYAGYTYCKKCNARIKVEEDESADHDYCENCNNLVPISELSLGYMMCNGERNSTGILDSTVYELAMLCCECKALDPEM